MPVSLVLSRRTNAAGLKLGDWTFRSATSDWIENNFSIISAAATNATTAGNIRLWLTEKLSGKLLIDTVQLIVGSTSAHSTALFYSFTLQSVITSTTLTNIAGVPVLNTQTIPSNDPRTYSQDCNVTVTIGQGGIVGFSLAIGKTSTPANINYDYRVTVRRIR